MRVRPTLIWILSAVTLSVLGYGGYLTLHAPLFVVRELAVEGLGADAPVDPNRVLSLFAKSQVSELGWNIFEAPLREIEARVVVAEPWVRSVRIERRLPNRLVLWPVLREAIALFQDRSGKLRWVDSDGVVFGQFDAGQLASLGRASLDLPLVSAESKASGGGAKSPPNDQVHPEVLAWLRAWRAESELRALAELNQLRAVPLPQPGMPEAMSIEAFVQYRVGPRWARLPVQLGSEASEESEASRRELLKKLTVVISYLSERGIVARQIRLDTGKKLVVKTGSDS